MRKITLLRLALGLAVGLPLGGCQNFNQCSSNADCAPAPDGTKLYCTPDNLCARGTPASALCQTTYPANAPANSIIIGALVNTIAGTGNDGPRLEAFKMAIDEVNPLRSPNPPLALQICEISQTADDPLKSMEILARQKNAVAVVGPSGSSKVLAIKDEVVRSGIPIMSPSATSAVVSALGGSAGPIDGLFYRVAPSDSLQGPVLARQLPPATTKLAVLFEDDPYGSGLKDAFIGASTKSPAVTVSYHEPSGGADVAATTAVVGQVLMATPDSLVAIPNLYPDTVLKALAVPFAGTGNVLMADAAKNTNVLSLIGTTGVAPFSYTPAQMNSLLGRVIGTAPSLDTNAPTYKTFVSAFKAKWTDDPTASIYTAFSYDAIYAIAIAIGAAGSNVSPAQVSQLLGHINKYDPTTLKCQPDASSTVTVGPSAFLAAAARVAAGSGAVLQGASGTICFTPHGDRVGGTYEKWTIDTVNKLFVSTPAL